TLSGTLWMAKRQANGTRCVDPQVARVGPARGVAAIAQAAWHPSGEQADCLYRALSRSSEGVGSKGQAGCKRSRAAGGLAAPPAGEGGRGRGARVLCRKGGSGAPRTSLVSRQSGDLRWGRLRR